MALLANREPEPGGEAAGSPGHACMWSCPHLGGYGGVCGDMGVGTVRARCGQAHFRVSAVASALNLHNPAVVGSQERWVIGRSACAGEGSTRDARRGFRVCHLEKTTRQGLSPKAGSRARAVAMDTPCSGGQHSRFETPLKLPGSCRTRLYRHGNLIGGADW